jgi:hypothetical protein
MVGTHKAQAFKVSKGTIYSWQSAAWCVGRRHSLKSAASLQGSKVEHCKKEAIQRNKDDTRCQSFGAATPLFAGAFAEGCQI